MEAHMERQGQSLPIYVQREFDDYLECGRVDRGCLRVRCEDCHHEPMPKALRGADSLPVGFEFPVPASVFTVQLSGVHG